MHFGSTAIRSGDWLIIPHLCAASISFWPADAQGGHSGGPGRSVRLLPLLDLIPSQTTETP